MLLNQLLLVSVGISRPPFNVLFLCTGNSARSILAECLLRELARIVFGRIARGAIRKVRFTRSLYGCCRSDEFLRKACARNRGMSSRSSAPVMNFVFTVCDQAAGEVCPVWPGQPVTAHWGIPDPAAADGSEAERMLAFRMLERRIKLFLTLPLASLDRIALKREVDAIGRLRPDTAEDRAS
jgi:arsenate reductase (thioredoxin)